MFSLDDFTDDCEPFFESEEDDFSSSGKHVDMLGYKKSGIHTPRGGGGGYSHNFRIGVCRQGS